MPKTAARLCRTSKPLSVTKIKTHETEQAPQKPNEYIVATPGYFPGFPQACLGGGLGALKGLRSPVVQKLPNSVLGGNKLLPLS